VNVDADNKVAADPRYSKELAFADLSHFARFFRKQTGTTPHDFREQKGG
jgi:AraC-like DNA-binding protein